MGRSDSSGEVSPLELRLILELLERIEQVRQLDNDHVTLAAVSEATGEDAGRLADLLDEIRRNDYEARLTAKLRELEEPLFRVERPGLETKSSTTETYLARKRTLNTLLDAMPTVDRKELPRKVAEPCGVERASTWAALIVLGLMLCLSTALVIGALTQTR